MSIAKRQHYVPQFYLRNFSKNDSQIFVFDKIENKQFYSGIDSVASTKFFYEWDTLNSILGGQYIEKKFSEFEGLISITIKELLNSLEANVFGGISEKTRYELSEFLWYQMIRNPEGRIAARQIHQMLLNSLGQNSGLEEMKDFDDQKEHLKMLLSGNISDRIKSLASRIWIFVKNETVQNFFTSDNPVIRYTHHERHHVAIEHFYPLSPKFGIMILYRDYFKELEFFENKVFNLDSEDYIRFYNTLQVTQSTRQIFSIGNDLDYVKELIEKNPELSDINRPRFIKIG